MVPKSYNFQLCLGFFIFILNTSSSQGHKDVRDLSFDRIYTLGVRAYVTERWYECHSHMIDAIKSYKTWQHIIVDCRQKCYKYEKLTDELFVPTEMIILDKFLRISSCVNGCKRLRLPTVPTLTDKILDTFERLEPYNYLQLCSYKVNELEQAVAAAYTYFLQNPSHEVMKNNLLQYRKLPEVEESFFIDVERTSHQALYIAGLNGYNEQVWLLVIDYMSKGVQGFYQEEGKCRLLCEEQPPPDVSADFTTMLAEHYIKVLKCQSHCEKKLSRFHEKIIDDYVADFYHYLQYAYFRVKDYKHACESVANFLLFKPDDETMNRNRLYYLSLADVLPDYFTPSEDAQKYYKKKMFEAKMLKQYEDGKLKDWIDVSEVSAEGQPYQPAEIADDDRDISQVLEEYKKSGIDIAYTEADLNGTQRVVADGFADEDTCKQLVELAHLGEQNDGYMHTINEHRTSPHTNREKFQGMSVKRAKEVGAVMGDGYHKKGASLHTKHETFEGMTIARGVQLVMQSVVAPEMVQHYLDLTERGREFAQKYFGLKNLYFDFTHLVCRTALDETKDRTDLSHPIHADNCLLQPDGSCKRQRPAYIERDYSAILYLNDDFEGGDFFFTHRNLTESASVRPKCGRMVAFNATNFHGVKAVLKGTRCAIAVWYTLDKRYKEVAHEQARNYIHAILDGRSDKVVPSKPHGPPISVKKSQDMFSKSEKSSHTNTQNTQANVEKTDTNNDVDKQTDSDPINEMSKEEL